MREEGRAISGLDVLGTAGRMLGYAGLVLAVGVGVFAAVIWPDGRFYRAYRRLLGWGLALLTAGASVEFLVQGAAGLGGGLGALVHPALLAHAAGSYLGYLLLLRLLLVALSTVALLSRATTLTWPELAVLDVGLAATFALAEYSGPNVGQLLTRASWSVLVLAIAVWLGGLAVLLTATWRPAVLRTEGYRRR